MLTAYRVEDIRAAEAELAATLTDGELMRRAARGLADALDHIEPGRLVTMLIGPGNNGGDALYAAAHLLDRGVRVDLCLLDPQTVHAEGLAAALSAGARVVESPVGEDHVVDAVFGIGARPGLAGKAAAWASWAEASRARVVAVDVPSGVDVDGGTLPAAHLTADRTVTFGAYKVALLAGPAADAAQARGNDLPALVDIGLGPYLGVPAIEAIEASDAHLLRHAMPGGSAQKYSRGVVGVAAGSEQYAGAAHLCVAGAQAGLAGMVRFVGAPALSSRVVDRAPEVVAGRGRVQAWVVGPGSGDGAAEQVAMALEDGVPVVVDASGLAHLPETFGVPAVLTPHAGELASMLATDRGAVEADPLAHVTAAAERWGATVLLTGRRTLVATPGRVTRVNLSGSPWLATAGAGDVLAGLVGSLLAAGVDPHDAASVAAFLHGAAAIRPRRGGPLTASEVAAALPGTVGDFLAFRLGEVRAWWA